MYEEIEVSKYLNDLVVEMAWNDCPNDRYSSTHTCSNNLRYDWNWVPIDNKGIGGEWTIVGTTSTNLVYQRTTAEGLTLQTTAPVDSSYDEYIPKDVLERIASIRDCYPDAKFDVSKITKRKADPFVRMRYAGANYVIAYWNEPGFKPASISAVGGTGF